LLCEKIIQMIDSDTFDDFNWFKRNNLKSRFLRDKKEFNDKSSPFWFRYYVLGRWIALKIAK